MKNCPRQWSINTLARSTTSQALAVTKNSNENVKNRGGKIPFSFFFVVAVVRSTSDKQE
jgi:hypothetical protein